MSDFGTVDLVEYEEMDTFSLEFYDYAEKEAQDLAEFNETLQDPTTDNGAQWMAEEEFRTLYNFIRRFNHTYKSFACEMRISVTTFVEEDQEEELLETFGKLLHNSLRRSDIIMRRANDFYLLLPDLSEQNKLSVLSRIRRNLQKAGLYSAVDMSVDSIIIGPDREYETWYRVAV